MVTMTTADPYVWPRTIIRGADNEWTLRRVDAAGTPYLPSEARAQVRGYFGGPVWVETDITLDPVDGWVTIRIPEAMTSAPEWDTRSVGIWDLECVTGGRRTRWVMGPVSVSQDVTRETP